MGGSGSAEGGRRMPRSRKTGGGREDVGERESKGNLHHLLVCALGTQLDMSYPEM